MKTAFRATLAQSAYALAAMPIAIVAFTVILTGLAVGAGLLITIIGLPILAMTAYLARGFAHAERASARAALGVDAPTPAYREAEDGGWLRRTLAPLGDPQSWLDIGFALLRLPLGIISFTLTLVWWSLAVGGLTWPIYGWVLPRGEQNSSLPELLGMGDSYFIDAAFYLVIGIVFAATLRWAVYIAAWIHAGPAVLMLSSRAAMQEEISAARASRDAGRTAQASELRRLERDIHDGPQQQLVRLSMDLGRARHQMARDPQRAQEILDEAIARSGATLDELRALSRGIAPPLLVDRGLRAALQEIVDRAPIPVHLEYEVDGELPDHVQTTVYFVVSEALTNMAKHAQASFGSVHVVREAAMHGPELRVAVTDDGVGGAHIAKGSGLSGLVDRVRSVDGMLDILSPAGGPTVIEARIPCE